MVPGGKSKPRGWAAATVEDIRQPVLKGIMIPSADLGASLEFYHDTLGLPIVLRDGDHFARLNQGGITVDLVTSVDAANLDAPMLLFKISDVDATARQLTGASVESAQVTGVHERRLLVRDPCGCGVVLYQPLK